MPLLVIVIVQGGKGLKWLPQGDVQARYDEAAEMRLRSTLLDSAANPAKRSCLILRRRAQAAVNKASASLELANVRNVLLLFSLSSIVLLMCHCHCLPAQTKFKIDDESRQLADKIMMQEDSFSAQPFQLDSTKFAAVLAQMRVLTSKVGVVIGSAMHLQNERRTHSNAQVPHCHFFAFKGARRLTHSLLDGCRRWWQSRKSWRLSADYIQQWSGSCNILS